MRVSVITLLIYCWLVPLTMASDNVICNAYIQGMQNQTRNEIICVGDSITEGTTATDDFGYRQKLQILYGVGSTYLRGAYDNPDTGYGNYSPYHEGISGHTTAMIKSRLPNILLNYCNDNYHHIVLLHAGTNGDKSTEELRQSYVDDIEDIIDLIDAYDETIDVYVSLIIPAVNDSLGDNNHPLYNAQLSAMLDSYDKDNLYKVDMYSAFTSNENWQTEYMYDSAHPNDAGYQVMAETWYAALVENGDA